MSVHGQSSSDSINQLQEANSSDQGRNSYCVALLAGPNVKLDGLQDLIAGGSAVGVQNLDYSDILGTQENEELSAQVKALGDGQQPPPELLSGLLESILSRTHPATSAQDLEGDEPGKELLRIEGGPRKFYVCHDFPLTEDLARNQVDGGFVDAVIFCTEAPQPADGGEEQATEDAETDPAILEERAKMLEEAQLREKTFLKLKEMASEAPPVGVANMANVAFGTLSVSSSDFQQALNDLLKLLVVMIKARVEYGEWMKGVKVVDAPAIPVDRRHYDRVLSSLPHSCLSVPIVLHALVEQVVQQAGPAPDTGHIAADANAREALKNNKVSTGLCLEPYTCLCLCF
jgi:hypothetical protein